MKLATFQRPGEAPRIGIVERGGLIDLAAADPSLPRRMVELIEGGTAMWERARQTAGRAQSIALDSVTLLAPIPDPPEFLGVGLNYHDHLAEAGLTLPAVPTVFNKQVSSIVGPFADVVLPGVSDQLDYEGELAFVVGTAGRHLTREAAAAAIFGYVVVNDLSVRDWQFSSPTVTLGKSFDTHGPFGPWIVTADEVGDPQQLAITTTVNGDVRQRGSTADMIFSCADILAFLSRVMTLRPGTVVTTGTPAGVGLFHRPPAFLRVGDVVTVDISGVGRLANTVIAESGSAFR
jgi:2-keto-4-pentenoate hydratase/2-oxohepta-3-ene-1,7-dioic acid hydratase in catechol pathway